jgi:hypothetical protein
MRIAPGDPEPFASGFGWLPVKPALEMAMRRWILCCTAALALAACATTQDLKVGLSSLVGQPAKVAIDRLGPPAGQTEVDGDKAYFWQTNHEVENPTTAAPNPESNLGVADPNQFAGGGTGPVATTAPASYQCWIRVTVGADDRIKTTAWGGNTDGCSAYAARLR